MWARIQKSKLEIVSYPISLCYQMRRLAQVLHGIPLEILNRSRLDSSLILLKRLVDVLSF